MLKIFDSVMRKGPYTLNKIIEWAREFHSHGAAKEIPCSIDNTPAKPGVLEAGQASPLKSYTSMHLLSRK